jgi:hypothetical protein
VRAVFSLHLLFQRFPWIASTLAALIHQPPSELKSESSPRPVPGTAPRRFRRRRSDAFRADALEHDLFSLALSPALFQDYHDFSPSLIRRLTLERIGFEQEVGIRVPGVTCGEKDSLKPFHFEFRLRDRTSQYWVKLNNDPPFSSYWVPAKIGECFRKVLYERADELLTRAELRRLLRVQGLQCPRQFCPRLYRLAVWCLSVKLRFVDHLPAMVAVVCQPDSASFKPICEKMEKWSMPPLPTTGVRAPDADGGLPKSAAGGSGLPAAGGADSYLAAVEELGLPRDRAAALLFIQLWNPWWRNETMRLLDPQQLDKLLMGLVWCSTLPAHSMRQKCEQLQQAVQSFFHDEDDWIQCIVDLLKGNPQRIVDVRGKVAALLLYLGEARDVVVHDLISYLTVHRRKDMARALAQMLPIFNETSSKALRDIAEVAAEQIALQHAAARWTLHPRMLASEVDRVCSRFPVPAIELAAKLWLQTSSPLQALQEQARQQPALVAGRLANFLCQPPGGVVVLSGVDRLSVLVGTAPLEASFAMRAWLDAHHAEVKLNPTIKVGQETEAHLLSDFLYAWYAENRLNDEMVRSN